MKLILLNIKNLLPYFLLIIIYFIIVNIEAQQSQYQIINDIEKNKDLKIDSVKRIIIPVIPYQK